MRIFSIVLVAFIILGSSVFAEDVEVLQVKDNIHVLISPSGGNVAVSTGEDGTFIIDDQLTGRSEIIQNAVRAINGQDIKFILNTHYHFDHTGGNEYFGKEGAIILAHDNVRERLSTKQVISYFQKELEPMAKAGLPTLTLTSDMTLHYNGDDIRFIHVPNGHTDGDTIAYFEKADVMAAGDLIFNGFYPFIDVEHGGTIQGIIAGHDLILNMTGPNTVIIPGHGPLLDKAGLKIYRDMLATISKRVEDAKKEGKSLAEIQAEKPTQEFDGQYGGGFISPDGIVEFAYTSLK